MKRFWSRLPRRQRLLLVVALVLAVVSAASLLQLGDGELPLPGTLRREEAAVRELQRDLARLEKEERGRRAGLEQLRQQARTLWRLEGKTPAVEVQAALEGVARRAHITLQNVGAPQTLKLSENVSSVQLSLRLAGSMQEVARFLHELEQNQPAFLWASCSLRPDNPREVRGVVLDGRVRALVITPAAAALLDGDLAPKGGVP